jgi:transcriptional regulator with XRE-family HTH domain
MPDTTLGERIKMLRESQGLSRAELMNTLSIHNLGRFESNERIPGAHILIVLSDFFNVSIDWILTGKDYSDKNTILNTFELAPEEIHFVKLLRKLPERERIKIEGMAEMKLTECQTISSPNSSTYLSGGENDAIKRDLA